MQLRSLLYYISSHLDRAAGSQADQVRGILATAVKNNNAGGVTGCLMHDENWFAQVLEGDVEAVSAIFKKIQADPRHGDVVVLENRPIKERRFPYWWMASMAWGDSKAIARERFGAADEFDPRAMRPDHLVGLMEAMLENGMRRPTRGEIGATARR